MKASLIVVPALLLVTLLPGAARAQSTAPRPVEPVTPPTPAQSATPENPPAPPAAPAPVARPAPSAVPAPPAPPAPPDPLGGNLFPPELVMRHQQAIGLTPEQKQALRDEVGRAQLQFSELQWDLQDANESMGMLVVPTRIDEPGVLEALDRVLDAEREIKRVQITLMVRIKNLLTPQQQDRLRQFRHPVAAPSGVR